MSRIPSFGAQSSDARFARMEKEPEQEALFYIEGPDEDGCVWIYGANTSDPWAQNLGPCRKVAEVFSQWLGSVDFDEVETRI
jgi:hypothetical protein